MARMSMETAIRLSAEVKGANNIIKVQRSLQDLAKGSKTTARDMQTLRSATFQYARANDGTIAGIRNSITAFRGLQEQAKIGSREFQRYGSEIQKLEAKLKGVDGTAQKAGKSLGQNLAAGLAAAGIGRALQGITMQAGKFDAELRKAAAIEGGAGSFDVLRKEIEAVASAAAGTPTEVAALATALSRAGFSAKETTEALRGIVRGAEATSVTFEEMGRIAADNLRAFGLQTGETARVVDVLTQSANKSNQTVLDLGESLKYAAPIARNLGVPLEDLAATMGLLANNGIRGSDAGTALRTGLTRLQIAASGSNEELEGLTRGNALLAKAMRSLGAEIIDTNGNLLPLDQVILSLRKNMQGLSAGRRAEIAKALFGDEAGSKFLALLNSSESQIRTMFAAVRDSGGVAEKTQKQMQGFDYSVKVLGGNLQNVTNQIGGAANVVFKPFVDFLNAVLSASLGAADPIKAFGSAAAAAGIFVLGLAVAINAVNAGLLALGGATAIKAAITGMFSLKAAAATATGAITGLKAAMLAIPGVGWAAAAIVGTGLLGKAVYDTNETFRNFVDNIGGVLAADFRTAVNGMATDAKAAAGNIDKSYKDLAKGMEPVADFIRQLFKDAFKDTSNSAQVSAAQSTGAFNEFFTSLSTSATAGFAGLNTIIGNWWNSLPEPIRNIFGGNAASMLAGAAQYTGGAIGRSTQTGPQRLKAAGSTATYTVGGITYDTATGAPVKPPPAFVPAPRTVPGNAMDTRIGDTVGGGGGKAAADIAKAREDAAKKMQQQLKAADAINVALKDRLAIAQTTEPVARQMLEYDIKQNELAREYEQLKSAAAGPDELILINANLIIEQRIAQIEHEEKINSLLADRAILMANVAAQAAMPTVYNELETQEAALQAVLDKYPAIGAAADAASTLATSGISEMIAGTKSAKEVFVNFLSSIADALMDTAKQMIAQYIAIGIARMFAGMGGSVATDAGGWATSFATPLAGVGTGFNFDAGAMTGGTPWSFAGGGYTGNAPRAGGVDGQGGFPAILHPRETVIDHTKAMSRQGAATTASAPVSVTVNVDASGNSQVAGDQNQGAQLGRVIAGAVQQELVRQKLPGGLLAS
jgi:TP901 family phage tail tape measure protein